MGAEITTNESAGTDLVLTRASEIQSETNQAGIAQGPGQASNDSMEIIINATSVDEKLVKNDTEFNVVKYKRPAAPAGPRISGEIAYKGRPLQRAPLPSGSATSNDELVKNDAKLNEVEDERPAAPAGPRIPGEIACEGSPLQGAPLPGGSAGISLAKLIYLLLL